MKQITCKKCGQLHDLKYLLTRGGGRALAYHCGKAAFFIKRIDGLDIPSVMTKGLSKELGIAPPQKPTGQQSLL